MSVYSQKWKTKRGSHKAWYVQFMLNRQVVHRKAVDPDTGRAAITKRDAEGIERKLRQQIESGSATTAEITLAKFIDTVYLGWAEVNHTPSHYQSDRWRTRVLAEHFGHLRITEISTFAVERFKRSYLSETTRRGERRSPASVNRCLQLLSKMLSMAVERKLLDANRRPKIKLLREENYRLRYLTIEEEQRLRPILKKHGEYLYDLVVVWLGTGLRANEIFRLQVDDVDFSQGVLHVLESKSGKPRQVPILGECLEVLARRCEAFKGFVFPSPRTGRKIDNVKKGFASACRDAGISGVTPHVLRHTYGTRLAAAGVDVATIRELMGHHSISTTLRYIHAIAENKHLAVKRLTDFVSEQSARLSASGL